MVVRKRQGLGIADHGGQDHALVDQPVPAHAQHGFVDVGVHHLAGGADLLGEGQGQVARAARDVQRPVAFLEIGHHHRIGLPGTVQTTRHQVVHDVVARSDRVEHAAHAAGLLALVHRLESEMCGAHNNDAKQAVVMRTATTPCGHGLCRARVIKNKQPETPSNKDFQAIFNIAPPPITLCCAKVLNVALRERRGRCRAPAPACVLRQWLPQPCPPPPALPGMGVSRSMPDSCRRSRYWVQNSSWRRPSS